MCGSGYSQYVTYAFADTLVGEDKLEDRDFPYPGDSPHNLPHEDPIASGAQIDANKPYVDVRDYGLVLLAHHTSRVLQHWRNVLGMLEPNFRAYVSVHFQFSEASSDSNF